jgi:hypothetical protein
MKKLAKIALLSALSFSALADDFKTFTESHYLYSQYKDFLCENMDVDGKKSKSGVWQPTEATAISWLEVETEAEFSQMKTSDRRAAMLSREYCLYIKVDKSTNDLIYKASVFYK